MSGTDALYLDIVQPFPPKYANLPDSGNLEAVKSLAKRHGQFMLIYWRLQRTSADNPAVVSFLDANEGYYLSGVTLAARQEALERRIIAILGRESVPSLVIKGGALARDVYGDVNSRCSSDIDILVKYGDAATVDRILSQSGFVRQGGRALEFNLLRMHHAQYYSPVDKFFIEIHWHFAVPCYFPISYEEIWAGVRYECPNQLTLTPEMNIIMLLMHHHSHAFRHLGILTDILWAFHKYRQAIDRQLFFKDIERFGLVNTMMITCGQLEDLWGDYSDELPLIEFRHADRAGRGLMGRYFRIYPGMAEKPVCIDKIAKRLALDSSRGVFMSFFRALFPPSPSIRRKDKNENIFLVYCKYLKEIIGCWLKRK